MKKIFTLLTFIVLSINANAQWTAVNSGLGNLNVNCIAISGNKIYAGTSGGLFFSNNEGATWTVIIDAGLLGNTFYSLAVSGNKIYAGTDMGLFFSNNNGITWSYLDNGGGDVYALNQMGSSIITGSMPEQ